jgi:hypothetical protein
MAFLSGGHSSYWSLTVNSAQTLKAVEMGVRAVGAVGAAIVAISAGAGVGVAAAAAAPTAQRPQLYRLVPNSGRRTINVNMGTEAQLLSMKVGWQTRLTMNSATVLMTSHNTLQLLSMKVG